MKNHVLELYSFGSVNFPSKFTEDSDVDFLVSFDLDSISLEEYAESYFRLTYGLEDLLKRDIDLTTEKSLSNPYFIEALDKTKVLIYRQMEKVDG